MAKAVKVYPVDENLFIYARYGQIRIVPLAAYLRNIRVNPVEMRFSLFLLRILGKFTCKNSNYAQNTRQAATRDTHVRKLCVNNAYHA